MSDHPSSHRLEELAAGVADAATEEHVRDCGACRAYVAKLEAGARAFEGSAEGDAGKFMGKVLARAERDAEAQEKQGNVRRLALTRVAWIAAPLAAAAILMLVMRPGSPPGDGPAPSAIRFKGGAPLLAAIVERDGRQERVTGEVRARAGDRLRLEVSVDHASPIVAGLLEADGAWTPLLAPAELDAGTHFSEQAARFDSAPIAGWILAGAPDAVEQAKRTRDFRDVAVLPIIPAP